MPIYEFKCLKCEEYIDILIMNTNDTMELKCKKCGSENLERILSSTNYSMNGAAGTGGKTSGVNTETKTCSSGSCTTYTIPGISK
jgi:putative FmdB family regulatory protein